VTSPRPPDLRISGVDCATQPRNVGLSLCSVQDGRPRLDEVSIGEAWPAIDRQIAQWLKGSRASTATSVLARLGEARGWPISLAWEPDDLELTKHEGRIWVSDVADSGSGA